MKIIRSILSLTGINGLINSIMVKRFKERNALRFPTFAASKHEAIAAGDDYFRYATIGLALQRVLSENIAGSLAEAGVYRGDMSRFIHSVVPDRTFFLFDTFEGFSPKDFSGSAVDDRFRDTGVEHVLKNIGNTSNVVIRKGYIPETFAGLDAEKFSFVLLDLDIYKPMKASLEFFYPRCSRGGYIIVHDYNNDESDWACKRAVDEFMKDKPEKIIEISDVWGSVLFRKL